MSCDCAAIAQLVERILGKDEVSSSNLYSSSSSEHLEVENLQGVFFVVICDFAYLGCFFALNEVYYLYNPDGI